MLLQSTPLQVQAGEQITDKILGANFLSLALFALILVIGIFLLYVWLDGKRQAAEDVRQKRMDERQDQFTATLLGENSPMVIAQNNIARILEKNEERASERTEVLTALGEKTDKQTAVIQLTKEAVLEQTAVITENNQDQKAYNTLMSDGLRNHDQRIEANTATIALLKHSIDDIPNQMRIILGEQSIRNEVVQLVTSVKNEIIGYLQAEQAKRITGTFAKVPNEDQTS